MSCINNFFFINAGIAERMVAATRSSSRTKAKTKEERVVINISSGSRSRPQRSGKVSCLILDSSDEADTPPPPPRKSIKGNTRKRKHPGLGGSPTKRHKKQKPAVQKSLSALNTCSSPKQLFLAMMGLSERQKEAIIQMGFGGLIGFCVNGVPEKLAYHVMDNFDAHSMTLNLGNNGLLVDDGVISELLGIRDSGSNFADVEEARTLHPSLKKWRARFPPSSYIAPSLISAAIQDDKYEDRVLKRLTAETRYEDFNWCAFIVDCLRKCKKKWRPLDPKCCWAGPLSILTVSMCLLLYVDYTQQPSCNTGDGIRAIHYWTKELLTRRQDYELSNGGFGRGQGKTLSDGLSGEQRVNSSAAANNAECGSGETSCLDKWIYDLSALRSRIEQALRDQLAVEPDSQELRRLRRRYIDVLDVFPCLPAEGLESIEEGELLKRTTQGSSSRPSALSDTDGAAGGGDVDKRSVGLPGGGNDGAIARESGDAGIKDVDGLPDMKCGLEQMSFEDVGTVNLVDNSQAEDSATVAKTGGSSDVNRPSDVREAGTKKGDMVAIYVRDGQPIILFLFLF
ncbi:hypothetical protein HanHA89_Chr02g0057211 [Helianthus annuus]|nr:hypothetical protein HanHA89_Chr02g0057211 [Helianthus annuus]